MEIIIDYNKYHDLLAGFIDPYEMPAAEMAADKSRKEEIVRCVDCIYWDELGIWVKWSDNSNLCKRLDAITSDDFFCKHGKRRADDET